MGHWDCSSLKYNPTLKPARFGILGVCFFEGKEVSGRSSFVLFSAVISSWCYFPSLTPLWLLSITDQTFKWELCISYFVFSSSWFRKWRLVYISLKRERGKKKRVVTFTYMILSISSPEAFNKKGKKRLLPLLKSFPGGNTISHIWCLEGEKDLAVIPYPLLESKTWGPFTHIWLITKLELGFTESIGPFLLFFCILNMCSHTEFLQFDAFLKKE